MDLEGNHRPQQASCLIKRPSKGPPPSQLSLGWHGILWLTAALSNMNTHQRPIILSKMSLITLVGVEKLPGKVIEWQRAQNMDGLGSFIRSTNSSSQVPGGRQRGLVDSLGFLIANVILLWLIHELRLRTESTKSNQLQGKAISSLAHLLQHMP